MLKVAFLWHMHQPWYRKGSEFLLPWVRLHGVKDYYDLPDLLYEFPDIRQTINIVPSLMHQINDYADNRVEDSVMKLSKIPAKQLSVKNKIGIIELFFKCNAERMILPYERYREFYQKSQNKKAAIKEFTEQDWLDLQTWYNLTWIGEYTRKQAKFQRLFKKGKNFAEEEKLMLVQSHIEILDDIKNHYRMLDGLGQVEFSVSPMYHPILPLLCNSASSREAMPEVQLPEPRFNYPNDAFEQINKGIESYKALFGKNPIGMWPSEGSISDESLGLIAQSGIHWVASDELILANTKGSDFIPTGKFFPWKFTGNGSELTIFFRDHFLSDNIGFVYSKWDPKQAASDFCNHLESIRNEIIKKHGKQSLVHACVSVILDGENCWEYYEQNGVPFLKSLYTELSNRDNIKCVTFSEAMSGNNYLPPLEHLQAGSWINANFKIWIGHSEDRSAWSILSIARAKLDEMKEQLSDSEYNSAFDLLMIAEGSDWFWWYGDEHQSEDKPVFDDLFRHYIKSFYEILNLPVPDEVLQPIGELAIKPLIVSQHGDVSPTIDGKLTDADKWDKAGYFDARSFMSTMHKVGELLARLWFASDTDNIYFRCDTVHQIADGEKIILNFINPVHFVLEIIKNGIKINNHNIVLKSFAFASDEIIEFSFSKETFFPSSSTIETRYEIELTINTTSKEGEISYPLSGNINIHL